MSIDYTARHGPKFNPFIKNTREIIVESADYLKAAQPQIKCYFDNK